MARYRVATESEIAEGQAIVVDAGERRLAVCRAGGAVYAIDDICTHDGGPLGEGELFGYEIECPRHGARFDVRTGAVTRMPAVRPVRTYPVEHEGQDLFVEVPEDSW
jgi:3-phenylpropionate/trans-cinnamate dioxygenase ferredoxin subunit